MTRKFLRQNDDITLPTRTETFNPHTFYKNRKGLYMWGGLERYVLPVAQSIEHLPEMTIGSFNLIKFTIDAEIRSELSDNHVFENADEALAVIGTMIENQPKGNSGALITNGYANIFYLRGANSGVFSVYVYWGSSVGEWIVHTASLGGVRRGAGDRVFSATTEPLKLCA